MLLLLTLGNNQSLEKSMAKMQAAIERQDVVSMYHNVPRYQPGETHSASSGNIAKNRYTDIVACEYL